MKAKLLLLYLLVSGANLYAQQINNDTADIQRVNGRISFLRFNKDYNGKRLPANETSFLRNILQLSKNDELRLIRSKKDAQGKMHNKYAQYYKGVKVDYAECLAHSQGSIESIQSNLVAITNLSVAPSVSERQALANALKAVPSEKYGWEDSAFIQAARQTNPRLQVAPRGELVIIQSGRKDKDSIVLAWKFDVISLKPFDQQVVYIHARTGTLLKKVSALCHTNTPGTAQTLYSGTRNITGDSFSGGFRLFEIRNNTRIRVLNLNHNMTGTGVEFVDNDNNWQAAEHADDQQALDLHWNAEQTFDYFLNTFGRNSMDGANGDLVLNAHYGAGVVNAFFSPWSGQFYFGDGGLRNGETIRPLTTLDVTAHELAHCMAVREAGLGNEGEGGAINEALSDIWGTVVRAHIFPAAPRWTMMGELGHTISRSLDNPNSSGQGPQPDTYNGNFYCPSDCDPHTNMSIMSHWFFRLVEGGSGTNDAGTAFSVNGIGMDAAAAIVYQAETYYMAANESFGRARNSTILAAIDLFGAGSCQEMAVTNAWAAVGVGPAYYYNPTITLSTTAICTASTATLIPNLSGTTITWTVSNPAIVTPASFVGPSVVLSRVGTVTGSTYLTASITGCGLNRSVGRYVGTGISPVGNLAKIENAGSGCGWDVFMYLPAGADQVQKSSNGGATWTNCPISTDALTGNRKCMIDPNVEGPATVSYLLRTVNNCGNGEPTKKSITLTKRSAGCGARIAYDNSNSAETIATDNMPGLSVYPNPTNGRITIELGSGYEGPGMVKVYHNSGGLIKSIPISRKGNKVYLDFQGMTPGLYMVHITVNNLSLIRKIIFRP